MPDQPSHGSTGEWEWPEIWVQRRVWGSTALDSVPHPNEPGEFERYVPAFQLDQVREERDRLREKVALKMDDADAAVLRAESERESARADKLQARVEELEGENVLLRHRLRDEGMWLLHQSHDERAKVISDWLATSPPNEEEPCERCEGSGRFVFQGALVADKRCPRCNGSGKKPAPEVSQDCVVTLRLGRETAEILDGDCAVPGFYNAKVVFRGKLREALSNDPVEGQER